MVQPKLLHIPENINMLNHSGMKKEIFLLSGKIEDMRGLYTALYS